MSQAGAVSAFVSFIALVNLIPGCAASICELGEPSVNCCIKKFPLTPEESCGIPAAEAATLLQAMEMASKAEEAEKAAVQAANADADEVVAEEEEDWSSIANLPEWKQRCIKYYNACQNRGWTGNCYDCIRRCEGQHRWPFRMCEPRRDE